MNRFLISTAYIYPVCPLSFNHARMYVIADVYARFERANGKDVYFPIATHYSGNTAQKVASIINRGITSDDDTEDVRHTLRLYRNTYGESDDTIRTFTDPMNILDYYNDETLWELKQLDIEADYSHQYTTGHADFSPFVQAIIDIYKKKGLLVKNAQGNLALEYENPNWRESATQLINRSTYIHSNQKNTVLSALKNIRSDWGLLRSNGYGAIYNGMVVDPMFDSEIFSIFDVYIKYCDGYPEYSKKPYEFFIGLFERLELGTEPQNELERVIMSWLPCKHFISEEHLRNWLAKKAHAESVLLNRKYQTKKYSIIGMGLLNGRRMSASRGTAVLSKDLINKYGPTRARLLMLLQGGHLSKDFSYDALLENRVAKVEDRFRAHLDRLRSNNNNTSACPESVKEIDLKIKNDIESGYLRNALVQLLETCPKRFAKCSQNEAYWLLQLYDKYIGAVLVPSLMKG